MVAKTKLDQQSAPITHDGTINMAVGTSRLDKKWHNETMQWSDFLSRLSKPTITQESYSAYMKMSKAKRDSVKDVGGYVGGFLKQGRRKADAVQTRSLVTLDADFATPTMWDDLQLLFENAIAVYSTHSYSSDNPRLRFIIPLSRPVTPEEYQPLARKLASTIGMNLFDDTTYQPERLMYWPSHAIDGEYFYKSVDTDWVNPEDVLAEYEDWRDSTFWPTSSREHEAHAREAKKQGDPLTKKGLIGAFCRTHTIEEAINDFLSDVYAPTEHEDRYTYIPGSTSGGLVIYDDKFAYSHHGTDPVGDTLNNAFDLVRKQKFLDLDDDVSDKTPATQRPSYRAMAQFIQDSDQETFALYQDELTGLKMAEAKSDFDKVEETSKKDDKDWLSINSKGNPEVNTFLLAKHIIADIPLYYNGIKFMYYDDKSGIWRRGAEEFLKSYITNHYLAQLTKINIIRETIAACQGILMTNDKFPDSNINKLVLDNGVLDISDSSFSKKYDPDYFVQVAHPITYDPKATAPVFKKFVEFLVGKKAAEFVYEWFGYCLYRGYPIQKLLFLYGIGGSGKTTLLNMCKSMIGDDAYSAVSLEALMTKNFATANLYQKTANFDTEAKPEYLGDAATLKSLTGEDALYADVKYDQPFTFSNFAKLTFSMNSLPPMRDFSGGLERRAIILKVGHKITEADKRKYPLKKMRLELAGIFNLAVAGLQRLLANGDFSETKDMKNELDEWLIANDSVGRFANEMLVKDDSVDTASEDLYLNYTDYTDDSGEKSLGKYKFYNRMQELGYERKRKNVKGDRSYYWIGVRLAVTDF